MKLVLVSIFILGSLTANSYQACDSKLEILTLHTKIGGFDRSEEKHRVKSLNEMSQKCSDKGGVLAVDTFRLISGSQLGNRNWVALCQFSIQ